MKEMVSKKTPMSKVVRMPYNLVRMVASGDTNRAEEIERPPTKAYSRTDASGKVLFAR